ncbi:SusD/RagB family nutrient-binding outer membrane lipoprotein [Sabulilitoribacter arenilitoris]|uniref:SusD/RagB family nutrient-binding outer membrane lipoprotein n=1 Tax=Wocania arenilitoris TaxID=2044858 RepID=A0AAE3EPZ1_9FLAO|nr:SusD/RagB family nutrient-binding outer membrane lipoprotein [Wocania arenilitoris]MCF7569533.1 SusD/RagB family nutrient-binding outer membrane lipoprotein [Wocania arenilitoris]
MKKVLSKTMALFCATLLVFSCSDFEEINENPLAATAEQVEVEFFINNSIGGAQQNPHIAERIFVLYWKDASRTSRLGVLSHGGFNDGWTNDYFNGYVSKWLLNATNAINVAEEKIATGNVKEYTENVMHIARIWRVYIMSEMSDTFGPIPIDGFKGENPAYNSVEEVYTFMLDELKDAVSKIDDTNAFKPDPNLDPAFGYDYDKWKKYGNSMRMRLAMRLSEVAPALAKQHFEEAANSGQIIATSADDMRVFSGGGWNNYTNPQSRQWNSHYITPTYRNLVVGLGSVTSMEQLPADDQVNIKPAGYLGKRFENHFSMLTNDPAKGFFLDGLPNTIDPRSYKTFPIPGNVDDTNYSNYPTWSNNHTVTERTLLDDNGDELMTIDAAFTYNATAAGNTGEPGSKNRLIGPGSWPRLGLDFRHGESERIFFPSWETHFLIAEAYTRGWNTPITGKDAYETGIAESFAYYGVSDHLATYIASEDYNNNGTSVSWDHTTEPPASVTMDYVDGYTDTPGTFEYTYPNNTIYEGGNVKNDLLTKIITQKFIASSAWIPLELWNDHRRLGLPFFENPAVEDPFPNMPQLNPGNVMSNQVNFFGQRVKYPSSFVNNIPNGHAQAVQHLGGPDEVHTPLWWAKQN